MHRMRLRVPEKVPTDTTHSAGAREGVAAVRAVRLHHLRPR